MAEEEAEEVWAVLGTAVVVVVVVEVVTEGVAAFVDVGDVGVVVSRRGGPPELIKGLLFDAYTFWTPEVELDETGAAVGALVLVGVAVLVLLEDALTALLPPVVVDEDDAVVADDEDATAVICA